MATPYRTRLWRTLALCMVLGAAGLGAYYYLVQEPLQADRARVQAELDAVREQIEDLQAQEPTPRALPSDRLDEACKKFTAALRNYPSTHDANAAVFAVEELARSAQFDTYRVTPSPHSDSPVQSAVQDRISLAFEGESLAIHRLIQNLQEYGKAGHISTLTLHELSDNEDDARARASDPPTFKASASLDAYTVPNASQLSADRCRELSVEE